MTSHRSRSLLAVVAVCVVAAVAPAQVVEPPRPEKYDVQFRYRIRTDRDERIRQFRAMSEFLKKVGFEAAPKEDADLDILDPGAESMIGSIAGGNAVRLLDDPRIQTVLLMPTGYAVPEDPAKPVTVRLSLATGFARTEQRIFHEQTVQKLQGFGFRENIGYDHANFSRVMGTVPAGKLLALLKDLRWQPSGWFLPVVPYEQLPVPFRNVLPVRLIEVLPDAPEQPAPMPAPAPAPGGRDLERYSQGLRAILDDPMKSTQPVRVEAILDHNPGRITRDLLYRIRTTIDGAHLESVIGPVATIRLAKATDADKLLLQSIVRTLRLPPPGHATTRVVDSVVDGPTLSKLAEFSRLSDLHKLGYRGEGVSVVVIGADFSGAAEMIGKELPKSTKIIDMTAELSPELQPLPLPPGHFAGGTQVARAVHAGAPAAQLLLVRVDPTAFHQLLTIARAVLGDREYSIAMQAWAAEYVAQQSALATRRALVTEEYRQAFSNLGDEDTPRIRREKARLEMDKFLADEAAFKRRVERFTNLKSAVDSLGGSGVVVNTLVWEDGYPNDGLSELSQLIDNRFILHRTRSAIKQALEPPVPVWIQAGSDAVKQVWAGPLLDDDGNGILDFAPPSTPIPAKRWTRELNFLRFVPAGGTDGGALPADFRIRLSIQWREPHDPDTVLAAEPQFPFTLRLLRQIDPDGKTIASDRMVEVAKSDTIPARILTTPGAGVYEQTIDVVVPAGVYALRVESRAAFEASIPARRRIAEIRPRIVVEPADAASAAKGLVLFETFTPQHVGVGIPGESLQAVTVGSGKPPAYDVPTSNTGAGPGVTLRVKPDLLTSGVLVIDGKGSVGTGIGTGFAGGVAASLLSSGVRAPDLVRNVKVNPGGPLVLPTDFLQRLKPRDGK